MPVIPSFQTLRQEDHTLKDSQGYTARPFLKTKQSIHTFHLPKTLAVIISGMYRKSTEIAEVNLKATQGFWRLVLDFFICEIP